MKTITLELSDEQYESLMGFCDTLIEHAAQRAMQLIDKKEPRYCSRQEAAAILHISLPTLHAMVNKGLLHPIRMGGRVMFNVWEITEGVNNGRFEKNFWSKKNVQRKQDILDYDID